MIRARYVLAAIPAIPLLLANPAAQPSVVAIRHWPEGDLTRVAIDVSGDFQFRSQRLHHPERIYFDIPGAHSPLGKGKPFSEETHDSLLRQIRVAAHSPGVTRVVLQLADGVETAASKSANPSRLDIQLRAPAQPAAADAQPHETPATRQPEPAAETAPKTAPETPKIEHPAPQTVELTLISGRGEVIDCPDGVVRISTSSPEVVDAAPASDTEVLFQAKALGQATLVVWSKSGLRRTYQVTVEPNLEPLRQLMRETFPDDQIDLKGTRDSLALVGRARSQVVADRALALISASMKGAVNNLQIAPAPTESQILLKVRFAEVDRSVTQEFGINLLSTGAGGTVGSLGTEQFSPLTSGTGGIPAAGSSGSFKLSDLLNIFAFRPNLNLGALIQDLENKGLLQILAEPNLVATNGKEATFLAGGEFPVPVVQAGASAGAITVQFKQYGIRLSFVPHVTARRTIQMHVKPEVSTIDPTNGVTVSGFNIPALTSRSVETDVELGEGQSFAIAGLLDQRVTQTLERMPGLASIPVLGALFRSRSVNKTKTELMVVVTPEIATPEMVMPVKGGVPLPSAPAPYLDAPKEAKK